MADAYQLPPATIQDPHRLVGRAHNQLYRRETFCEWLVSRDLRQRSAAAVRRRLPAAGIGDLLGRIPPVHAARLPRSRIRPAADRHRVLQNVERMHADTGHAEGDQRAFMSGFYVLNNATIGLRCFAFGLLAGIGGLYETVYNAATLGDFGYIARSPSAGNFFPSVTAHGPFELTAIVLMAAAGMRLGFSLIDTRGRSRADALRRVAKRSVPVIAGRRGPLYLGSRDRGLHFAVHVPYAVKAGVALLSIALLIFYFVVLGYPGVKHEA